MTVVAKGFFSPPKEDLYNSNITLVNRDVQIHGSTCIKMEHHMQGAEVCAGCTFAL